MTEEGSRFSPLVQFCDLTPSTAAWDAQLLMALPYRALPANPALLTLQSSLSHFAPLNNHSLGRTQ